MGILKIVAFIIILLSASYLLWIVIPRLTSQGGEQPPCSASFSISSSGMDRCTITVNVTARHCGNKSYEIKDGGINCSGTITSDSFSRECNWNVSSGRYNYKLYIDGNLKSSESVTCSESLRTCSDGTIYGECSSNQPLYCDDGNLINKCRACGCPTDKSCNATAEICYTPSQRCSEGTPYSSCSSVRPKYCDDGNLVDKCSLCGCPTGKNCNTTIETCYTPALNCSDGTSYNQCSQTKPLYCDNGFLVDRCSICGCPSGKSCNTTTEACYTPALRCSDGTPYDQCSLTKPLYCDNGVLVDACGSPQNCSCDTGYECNATTGKCNPERFLFMDTYEDNPTVRVMDKTTWLQVIDDTKKGNYWVDSEHWLEKGWVNATTGLYTFDTRPIGNATVTGSVAYNGIRSVETTIPSTPTGYMGVVRWFARYFRNQSLYKGGVYDVGAWFYVPSGNNPTIYLAMEDHPSWLTFYIVNVALITENGSVIVYYKGDYYETIGTVNFQHNTWFKLWITYNTQERNYTARYRSSIEEKTFNIDKVWTGHYNTAYIGYKAFNFYAGGNTYAGQDEQKVYVDDFYAKLIG